MNKLSNWTLTVNGVALNQPDDIAIQSIAYFDGLLIDERRKAYCMINLMCNFPEMSRSRAEELYESAMVHFDKNSA
jgi:hypothetical protein